MSTLEWIAFVTNVVCVYLLVRERDVNWPLGVLGSLALLAVFWQQKLYAQVGLQMFYVVECLYGWWMWTRRDRRTGRKRLHIGGATRRLAVGLTVAGAVGMAVLYPIFRMTDDPAPFWDSAITVASLVAEYMLCLKLYESWGLYLAADVVSLAVLAALGMWLTFGTYALFVVLCVMGIVAWRKALAASRPDSCSASSTLSPEVTST